MHFGIETCARRYFVLAYLTAGDEPNVVTAIFDALL
jgi:hypothetical protein